MYGVSRQMVRQGTDEREVRMTGARLVVVRELAKKQLGEHASVRSVVGIDSDVVVAP
jgi:hypothetical protein